MGVDEEDLVHQEVVDGNVDEEWVGEEAVGDQLIFDERGFVSVMYRLSRHLGTFEVLCDLHDARCDISFALATAAAILLEPSQWAPRAT